jgi:uncharacterized glyoxalase superfamily protein PhnB
MSDKISTIRSFVETNCEKIGNGSFIVPPSLYGEFLLLINNVDISDRSHFGKVDYAVAYKYPYGYKRASFTVKEDKVFIVCGDNWDYTGCILTDETFENIRINLYSKWLQVLFDYRINGYRSLKSLSYDIGQTADNTEIAKIIREYRINYYSSLEKANNAYKDLLFLLRGAENAENKVLYSRIAPLTSSKKIDFLPGTSVYILSNKHFNKVGVVAEKDFVDIGSGKKIAPSDLFAASQKPHPFDYKTLVKIQNAILSINLPSIIVESAFVAEGNLNTVWISCLLKAPTAEDACRAVFESVLADTGVAVEILSDIRPYGDRVADMTDAYDIFSGQWATDILSCIGSNNLCDDHRFYEDDVEQPSGDDLSQTIESPDFPDSGKSPCMSYSPTLSLF